MANLSAFLVTRLTTIEDNLERGRVYMFTTGNQYTPMCFCWKPPSSGTAIIEAWGSGGSGARMCCCGFGIPGNSGAYAKRTITVTPSCFISGCAGFSCGNSDALCFRGCSAPTAICWTGNSGSSGCMCVQGGKGGVSICSTSTAGFCCFVANGFCFTCCGPGCGIVCNVCSGEFRACAYGGDINCCSNFSCVYFNSCGDANYLCGYLPSMAYPSGLSTTCGQNVNFVVEDTTTAQNGSSAALANMYMAYASASKTPGTTVPMFACWGGIVPCGCYEENGCISYAPMGVGGMPAYPCAGVRDGGGRGGHGGVKITFYT